MHKGMGTCFPLPLHSGLHLPQDPGASPPSCGTFVFNAATAPAAMATASAFCLQDHLDPEIKPIASVVIKTNVSRALAGRMKADFGANEFQGDHIRIFCFTSRQ